MKLDELRKLHVRKHREAAQRFLVEGEHPVLELQKAAMLRPELAGTELLVTREHANWRSPFPVHVISALQMARLSDTRSPQGIIAVAPLLRPIAPRRGERAVYLHEVADPGNLGTILRTLAWFGRFRCLLSSGSVDPYNSKVVRASSGAIFHVPVEEGVALPALAQRYPRIACLDLKGEGIDSPGFRECDVYVFGNEARGLPRAELAELKARSFTIHGGGSIESLNLAAALNMCAYELHRA
ncbi:MAG: RNA methyltransferase [Proteobacteria bacterium]|nr:RNA methyltransferase [Pseudomonadota bacterium]